MLRSFLRMLSRSRDADSESTRELRGSASGPPRVLLYAHVDRADTKSRRSDARLAVESEIAQSDESRKLPTDRRKRPLSRADHRAWLFSMRMEHTRLVNEKRCSTLRKIGILTAGDLAFCDPAKLSARLGGTVKTMAILAKYRRAIRLAAAVPGMMPLDALLLISIHRRSLRGLAAESAAALYRDLQRFAISTNGRRLMKGRQVPSQRRLKKWIAACDSVIKKANSGASKGSKPSRVVVPRLHSAA